MPLTLCPEGEENIIKRIGGKEEIRRHLENLGFVPGGTITIVSRAAGNIIVNIKESRIAVSSEMASKIMV
ncbi:MAG: ferrous iron transport protein A [Clostridiales bacterium]|nr:ferrous iron transport protein A [Clostridiales bacterium]MCD8239093.1 ferrous iron transport protein A [Clostridiales bacterium]